MPIKLTMVRSGGVAIDYLTKPTVTQFVIRFLSFKETIQTKIVWQCWQESKVGRID